MYTLDRSLFFSFGIFFFDLLRRLAQGGKGDDGSRVYERGFVSLFAYCLAAEHRAVHGAENSNATLIATEPCVKSPSLESFLLCENRPEFLRSNETFVRYHTLSDIKREMVECNSNT